MGNIEEAPKAARGWYPMADGQPGKRFWDGHEWTGATKGLPKEPSSREDSWFRKNLKFWLPAAAAIVVIPIVIFGLIVPLVTSAPTVEVPNLVGQSVTDAHAVMEASKLSVGIDACSDDSQVVVYQSVEPGTKVAERKAVNLQCGALPGSGSLENLDASGRYQEKWWPDGFNSLGLNPSFAVQWVKGAEDPCGSSACNYWTINIVSQSGCPGGVYVEVNMLDSAGTVFDWSNDTVPALAAGQVAQLQFLTYAPRDGSKAQVANVSCY